MVVLRSKSGLRVPLVERLKARVELKLDWERRPSPGRRRRTRRFCSAWTATSDNRFAHRKR
jgi:hypothetical protein